MLSRNVNSKVLRTVVLTGTSLRGRRRKSAICVGEVKQPHLEVMIIVPLFPEGSRESCSSSKLTARLKSLAKPM